MSTEVIERTPVNEKSRVASQMVMKGDVGAVYGGVKIECAKNPAEALALSGLDFEVKLRNICMSDKTRTPIPGYRATYRTDTNQPLGVVGSRYTPYQNMDAFAWVEKLMGLDDAACIVAAGTLYDGAKTFLVVDFGGFDVLPEDAVRKHVLIMNSHDGTSNICVQVLGQRPACQNILNFAFGGALGGDKPMKVKHTPNADVRMADVGDILKFATSDFAKLQESFGKFRDTRITPEQADEIAYRVLGVSPQERKDWLENRLDRQPHWVNKMVDLRSFMEQGPGMDVKGIGGTLWGVYNGLNGYYNYRSVRGSDKKPDVGVESKILGYDAGMNQKVFTECLAFANRN